MVTVADLSEQIQSKSKRGRRNGPDPTIRKQLLSLIRYILTGKTVTSGELNVLMLASKDKQAVLQQARQKWMEDVNKSRHDEWTISKKLLQSYAKSIFGIVKNTFLSHVDRLIEEGVIKKASVKGRGRGYQVIVDDLLPYVRHTDETQQDVVNAISNIFSGTYYYSDPEFYETLEALLSELSIETNNVKVSANPCEKAMQIMREHKFIKEALYDYVGQSYESFVKETEERISKCKTDSETYAVRLEMFSILMNIWTASLKRLLREIVLKDICPLCLVKRESVVTLQKIGDDERNGGELVTCTVCNEYTADKSEPEVRKVLPSSGYTHTCLECGSHLRLRELKNCTICGSANLKKIEQQKPKLGSKEGDMPYYWMLRRRFKPLKK